MKKIGMGFKLFVLILLLPDLAMAGWFSSAPWEHDNCTETHSYTWCFAKTMTETPDYSQLWRDIDLSQQEYDQLAASGNSQEAGLNDAQKSLGTLAIGGAALGMSPAAVASSVQSSIALKSMLGIGLLNALQTSRDQYMHVYLVAHSREQLRLDQQAMMKIIDEKRFEAMHATSYDRAIYAKFDSNIVRIRGGDCDQKVCTVWLGLADEDESLRKGEYPIREKTVGKWYSGLWFESESLDNFLSLTMGNIRPAECDTYACKNAPPIKTVKLNNEELIALSAKLPASVFIYLPPGKEQGYTFPCILNQGKMMLWIRRKSEVSQAASR